MMTRAKSRIRLGNIVKGIWRPARRTES